MVKPRLGGRPGGIVATAALVAVLMAPGITGGALAGTPQPTAFSAHGSVNQVYATGLPPGAEAALFDPSGRPVTSQAADSLGGLLFRDVPAGAGYRVRLEPNGPTEGPVTVHTAQSAPWDPGIYKQTIPDRGYTYLTTRSGVADDLPLLLGPDRPARPERAVPGRGGV